MKSTLLTTSLIVLLLTATGCATGQKVNYSQISAIQKNVTSERQILTMFGKPSSIRIDTKSGMKTLTYTYKKDDSILRSLASTTGALTGGILAHKNIGNGSGKVVSGSLGATLGGYAGRQATSVSSDKQVFTVNIDMHTNIVADFNYIQTTKN